MTTQQELRAAEVLVGQLDLLLTSPRVAPGLLSFAAWQAISAAKLISCADLADSTPAQLIQHGLNINEFAGGPVEQARALLTACRDGSVLWLGGSDGDPGLTDALATELSVLAAAGRPIPVVELIVGSHDLPGARLLDVVAVMDRLRSPGGCPWDAEQTHQSLARYLLEETHEALEAIASGEAAHLREELGDVLLQVVFQARVAADSPTQAFDIDDIAGELVEKMLRRHPQVFDPDYQPAGGAPLTAAAVEQQWQHLKAAEKQRGSALDGIAPTLPALARANKILARVARSGPPPAQQQALIFGESAEPSFSQRLLQLLTDFRTVTPTADPEVEFLIALAELESRFRQWEATA